MPHLMTEEEFYTMIDVISKTSDMKDALNKQQGAEWKFYNAAYKSKLQTLKFQAWRQNSSKNLETSLQFAR